MIGSRNSRYPRLLVDFETVYSQNGVAFLSVTDEESFVLKEEAIAANTKRATKFGFSEKTKDFFLEFAENPRECSSKKSESARAKDRKKVCIVLFL